MGQKVSHPHHSLPTYSPSVHMSMTENIAAKEVNVECCIGPRSEKVIESCHAALKDTSPVVRGAGHVREALPGFARI